MGFSDGGAKSEARFKRGFGKARCWFSQEAQEGAPDVFASCLLPHLVAMPIPSLPFEITEKIIHIAVRDLIAQERNHPIPLASSLVNAFLLSTSLVSPTWRSISQLALLRNGLVSPSGARGFLCQLGRRGIKASTRSVRIWTLNNSGILQAARVLSSQTRMTGS